MVEWTNSTRSMVDNSFRVRKKLLIHSEAFFVNSIGLDHLQECLNIENSMQKTSSARSTQDFKDMLGKYSCFGLFDDNENMVGYAFFSCVLDESELLDITILKSAQGKNLAYNFLDVCFNQFLKNQDITQVILEVATTNIPAIKTYQKFSFEQIGIRKDYYLNNDGSKTDALVYKILI